MSRIFWGAHAPRVLFSAPSPKVSRAVNRFQAMVEKLDLAWIHPMHGGSFDRRAFGNYAKALRENEFAYRGMLLGREVAKAAPM